MSAPSLDSLPETARLDSAAIAALALRHAARWRLGLVDARHSEIFASSGDAAGAGLALALANDTLSAARTASQGVPGIEVDDRRSVLWVQDSGVIRRSGRPYRPGLPPWLRERVIHVAAKDAADALFALEEGLRCRDLACVIGELAGNPRSLDFTASRRLSLAAERHGVPLWLVRVDAARDLSSARLRWEARQAASSPPEWNRQAPGDPAWRAELFRARTHAPGQWLLRENGGALEQASLPPAGIGQSIARCASGTPFMPTSPDGERVYG